MNVTSSVIYMEAEGKRAGEGWSARCPPCDTGVELRPYGGAAWQAETHVTCPTYVGRGL